MFKFQNIKIFANPTRFGSVRHFSLGSLSNHHRNSSGGFDTSHLDRSFMKVVGAEVDTRSDDYLSNYEQMMLLNEQLDQIVHKTVDVG